MIYIDGWDVGTFHMKYKYDNIHIYYIYLFDTMLHIYMIIFILAVEVGCVNDFAMLFSSFFCQLYATIGSMLHMAYRSIWRYGAREC